jgi:hypothetical protein
VDERFEIFPREMRHCVADAKDQIKGPFESIDVEHIENAKGAAGMTLPGNADHLAVEVDPQNRIAFMRKTGRVMTRATPDIEHKSPAGREALFQELVYRFPERENERIDSGKFGIKGHGTS